MPAVSTPKKCCKSEQEGCAASNYLIRGGARAYEHKIQEMNQATMQVAVWGFGFGLGGFRVFGFRVLGFGLGDLGGSNLVANLVFGSLF